MWLTGRSTLRVLVDREVSITVLVDQEVGITVLVDREVNPPVTD